MKGHQKTMKFRRIATALLLQMTLISTGAAQRPSSPKQNERLSIDEEREASAIAADFVARFEDSADIKQLMHLFTSDFPKRLRNAPDGAIAAPFAVIESSVIRLASDDELLACYIETINFMYLVSRHYGAAEWLRTQSSNNDQSESDELTFTETLPLKVVELLKGDPIMSGMLRDEEKHSARKSQTEQGTVTSTNSSQGEAIESGSSNETNSSRDESLPSSSKEGNNVIKTISGLRSFVSTLERANALMRDSAKSLITMKALMEAFRERSATDEKDILKPRAYDLSNDWFGYSAGKRLICVNVLLFHMDLARVHGGLQVASLYVESSCGS